MLQALADIGIRHIRDGCFSASHGVNEMSVDVLCIPEATTSTRRLDFSQLETLLLNAKNMTRLVALEGPNEYDLAKDPYWPQMLSAYQGLLANISRQILPSSPALPVVAPSMGWGPQHAVPICADDAANGWWCGACRLDGGAASADPGSSAVACRPASASVLLLPGRRRSSARPRHSSLSHTALTQIAPTCTATPAAAPLSPASRATSTATRGS
jgi:hypothetical protein